MSLQSVYRQYNSLKSQQLLSCLLLYSIIYTNKNRSIDMPQSTQPTKPKEVITDEIRILVEKYIAAIRNMHEDMEAEIINTMALMKSNDPDNLDIYQDAVDYYKTAYRDVVGSFYTFFFAKKHLDFIHETAQKNYTEPADECMKSWLMPWWLID